MIEKLGAFWFWFDTKENMEASLLKFGIEIPVDYVKGSILNGDSVACIPWGEVSIDSGTVDGNGFPIMINLTGQFALLLLSDIDVPYVLSNRIYKWPDDVPWPVEPAGWRGQIAICQELAGTNPTQPVTGVVSDLSVLNEAQLARRAARLEANLPVIEQARLARSMRNNIDSLNTVIQTTLPTTFQNTVTRIADNVSLRATSVTERAAQAAIAADVTKTTEGRRVAREERNRLVELIASIDEQLVKDRAWRDGYTDLITSMRATRDSLVSELIDIRTELDSRKIIRDAAIAAINSGT